MAPDEENDAGEACGLGCCTIFNREDRMKWLYCTKSGSRREIVADSLRKGASTAGINTDLVELVMDEIVVAIFHLAPGEYIVAEQ